FEVTLSPLPRSMFSPKGVLSAARDVTERVRSVKELALSEERFRSVYRDSPVGIALADEEGRLVEANPALCRLLRRAEPDLVGLGLEAFVPPEDAGLGPVLRFPADSPRGHTRQVERRIVRDDRIRWAWISMVRVPGPQDRWWTLAHVQ